MIGSSTANSGRKRAWPARSTHPFSTPLPTSPCRSRRRRARRESACARADLRCRSIVAKRSCSAAARRVLRAAVELKRRHVDVVVATQAIYGGTSACSGSDKQTLHTACDSAGGDDFDALAEALGAGGAMDEDTAYVEAVGSLQGARLAGSSSACRSRATVSAPRCATRPTMTRPAAPPVAGRAPRG